ncbi:hypothetical protein RHMOL_Rhmol03G0101600 [Rhododendron molle]|uniref:Uncharacterized protein n=1 Tax=Rhododendron molle TaxID=49168 RepID=A0ACC0PE12_RHOML|nr:hypothetical protein RHMOL_Rhmol03G0101600 [Rhododendron molle]
MSIMLFVERVYMAIVIISVKLLGKKRYTKYKLDDLKEDLERNKSYPLVLIQIPMYNEKEVYKLSIGAACALSWPSDHLIVQVLDDSTNEVLRRIPFSCLVYGVISLCIFLDRSMEKKTHRKWNDEEDRELIYALHDLVNKGDKRDNGFKAGSLTVIEGVLHEKLPGHGIKAKPHIESRIKTSKKDVCIVYDMIYGGSTSGFGWDPNTNMVVAEKHIWDDYVKSHKDAANWRNRSFPHFDMLLTVFGKDRATGKNAVTAEDVLEEESRNEGSCDTENLGIGIEEMEHFVSSTNGEESNGKKRKRSDDSLDAFREAATIIGSKIEEATNKFSQALGVDLAIAKKRDKVNDELRKLSNLSMIQRHRVLLAIARDHATTACFFTLKDDEKEDFVMALLRGDL